jgi:hypothetical protein
MTKTRFQNFLIANQGKKVSVIILLCLIIFLVYLYNSIPPVLSWGNGSNYKNYSVRSTVNVTNAYPEIINITCNSGASITLTAGSTKTVSCLVQIRDYNGGNTINYVNGTFYYYLNQSSDPDDNNTHYTNATCINETPNGYYVNWTCAFDVWYYANNGSWRINSTVNDSFGAKDNDYNNATISALLALNVTDLIDFGQLAVTQTSLSIQANVTNFGNRPINVTVYGFGGNDSVAGAGLAMNCTVRNISISNERYDINASANYDLMTSLTGSPIMIPGIKIEKQTLPDVYAFNSTYWRLHVNITTNPFGVCNGTVVFSAESP